VRVRRETGQVMALVGGDTLYEAELNGREPDDLAEQSEA
jgi:hypothetical protein